MYLYQLCLTLSLSFFHFAVIAALHSIYAGSLSPTLAKTAIDFIETNLSSKTVGTQFETLIRDGVAAKAVDTLFHRHDLRPTPSSSPTKVRAEHADYGDDTDEYCFSLMSQDPERYLELQSLPKGRIPAWVLLWSNVSTIDWQQIDNIRKYNVYAASISCLFSLSFLSVSPFSSLVISLFTFYLVSHHSLFLMLLRQARLGHHYPPLRRRHYLPANAKERWLNFSTYVRPCICDIVLTIFC